ATGSQEGYFLGVPHEERAVSILESNDGPQASKCSMSRNRRTDDSQKLHAKPKHRRHPRDPQEDEPLRLPLPDWSKSPAYRAAIKDVKFESHDACCNSDSAAERVPLLGDLKPRIAADVEEWADHMPHSL
ncbi:unnamed protein product, partial [Amoebophrya sp. A25]